MITVKRTTSHDDSFIALTAALDEELRTRYGSTQEAFDQYNIITDSSTVVIAFDNTLAVGCACFKETDRSTVELKRMYVKTSHRGKGFGVAILTALENWAIETGYHTMILETGTLQPEAIQLYKKQGYRIIPNFAPYIGNELSVCMRKVLVLNSR